MNSHDPQPTWADRFTTCIRCGSNQGSRSMANGHQGSDACEAERITCYLTIRDWKPLRSTWEPTVEQWVALMERAEVPMERHRTLRIQNATVEHGAVGPPEYRQEWWAPMWAVEGFKRVFPGGAAAITPSMVAEAMRAMRQEPEVQQAAQAICRLEGMDAMRQFIEQRYGLRSPKRSR